MTLPIQAVMDALAGVAYAIDAEGRIVSIGRRGWRLFAAENDGLDLADPAPFIGRNVFEFITGEDVRAAYRRLLERLRMGEPQVTLPCRCDAPAFTRDMRLTISPLKSGRTLRGYLFQSIAFAEHARPAMPLYAFADHYPDSVPLLGMCSLCERVCVPSEDCSGGGASWLEAESYYARGGSSHVRISHTVCPACFSRWVQGWMGAPPPVF